MKQEKFRKYRGFTLVQLIIAVSIIVILGASIYFSENIIGRIGEANDAKRLTDIRSIAQAIELYEKDNHQLPSDFATSTLSVGEKFVLCSSEATNTCDGQTKGCLVVDDTDFLGVYLGSLPVDPEKTADTDTGYYITRTANDAISIGACNTYGASAIDFLARATLPDLVASCGDGFVDTGETCDDGDTITEGCGNGYTETAGSDYCNSTCTATITISTSEVCDDGDTTTEQCGDGVLDTAGQTFCNADCSATYYSIETCEFYTWTNDCDMIKSGWVTEADLGSGPWCLANCRSTSGECLSLP